MRGATLSLRAWLRPLLISIHAPHARSDHGHALHPHENGDFNPRSSCEERLSVLEQQCTRHLFQSTLLMRGATYALTIGRGVDKISIHAPHARSDGVFFDDQSAVKDFNPRSSCEERLARDTRRFLCQQISIHAPHARSDRCMVSASNAHVIISIHAPHARSDEL